MARCDRALRSNLTPIQSSARNVCSSRAICIRRDCIESHSGGLLVGVLLQGFFKMRPNRAVASPADGGTPVPWWGDHLAEHAASLRRAAFPRSGYRPPPRARPGQAPELTVTALSTITISALSCRWDRRRRATAVASSYSAELRRSAPADSGRRVTNIPWRTLVLASEIEQLPELSGFLKIASGPEWIEVHMKQGQS